MNSLALSLAPKQRLGAWLCMIVALRCRYKSPPVLLRIKQFLNKERLKSKSFHPSLAFEKTLYDL